MVYYSALHWAKKAEKSAEKCEQIQEDLRDSGLDLSDYAKKGEVVHNTGDETIDGVKTFKDNIHAPNQVDYNHITNCITEMPQDIKLELNNGTLTLKAGSKIYAPNGVGVFDEVVTASDLTTTIKNNGTYLIYKLSGNAINYQTLGTVSSGSTDSLSNQNWHIWYDTTNNLIKRYGASAQLIDSKCSFPIALITVSNGAISSIDQIFNGFGYIGSTVFALPGVKGLIPNGRNEDGSLKNIEVTIPKVCTITLTGSATFDFRLLTYHRPTNQIVYTAKSNYSFDEEANYNIFNTHKDPTHFILGNTSASQSKITLFTPKLPFRAADEQNTPKLDGDNEFSGTNNFNGMTYFNKTATFVKNTANTVDTHQDIFYIRDENLETNNVPYNKTYYTNALMDKNNKFVTYIQNTHAADGTSTISINARTQNANGDNVTGSIGVEATKNGNVYATAPAPVATSSMDSKQISTVGWVNDPTKSTNVVHRTGNETIEGRKTFKSSQGALNVRFTGADSEVLPTSTVQNKGIRFEDKNGVNIGNIVNRIYTNGAITEELEVCRKINGAYKYGSLGVIMSNTGVVSTSAPTPPAGDNSTQIATTAWVNTTLTTAISEFVKGGSHYIKIPVSGKTNPLIIQWGYVADGEKTSTITFPTPFTADNFCLTSQAYWDNSGFTVSSYEHTKTSFTYVRSRGDVSFRWIAVGY